MTGWTVYNKDKQLLICKDRVIKHHSMRETLLFKKYNFNLFYYFSNTKRYYSINRYNEIPNDFKFDPSFCEWLVGFTDGDGYFRIIKSKNSYRLEFDLSQSFYNIRLLYKIKSKFGYGSVTKIKSRHTARFRITDKKVLTKVIFPIFDKYSLLTTKQYNYIKFKKAYTILEDKNLTILDKNSKIEILLSTFIVNNYISTALKKLDPKLSSNSDILKIISYDWLTGFIEAKGYFGIILFKNKIYTEFNITQKLDSILLEYIRRIFHIPGKLVYFENRDIYQLKTKNSRAVQNIIDLMNGKFKGIKSLEFKLWSKAFYYRNTNLIKVTKIYQILKKFRSKK